MTNHFHTDQLLAEAIGYQYEYKSILQDVNVELGNGDCLHVIGGNGAGKTTLMEILAGYRRNFQGKLQWNREEIGEQYYQDSLYIGHKKALSLNLTAAENCSAFMAFAGRRHEIEVQQVLAFFELDQYANVPVSQLSTGQRHKLALSRLLLTPARIWLLDEPFTSLDVSSRYKLDELIRIHLDAGGLVVLTSHDVLSAACQQRITLQMDLSV